MRKFLKALGNVDRGDAVRNGRNKASTLQKADGAAPILVPDGAGVWTFGDHPRHLAAHAGTIPLALDEYVRCVICVRRGFLKPNT